MTGALTAARLAEQFTAPLLLHIVQDTYGNPAVARFSGDGTVERIMQLCGSDRGRITYPPQSLRPVTPEQAAWACTAYTAVTGRAAQPAGPERIREAQRLAENKAARKAERAEELREQNRAEKEARGGRHP